MVPAWQGACDGTGKQQHGGRCITEPDRPAAPDPGARHPRRAASGCLVSRCGGGRGRDGAAAYWLRYGSGRALIDGATGRQVPAFDGRRFLRVTYLPPGYRLSGYFPAGFASWDRQFSSSQTSEGLIEVDQVPGNVAAWPTWPVESSVTVHGRPATVRVEGDNGRAISWAANSYTFVVRTIVVQAGQRPLPVAELTRIAAGLH